MQIGEELEVKIISRTERGEGISHKNGDIVIVYGAHIGQTVRVKVVEKRVTKVFCEVIEFLG